MSPSSGPASPAHPSFDSQPDATWWQPFANFIVRRRVRIMSLVLVFLVLEDVFSEHLRPHSPIDVQNLYAMVGVGLVLFGMLLRSWAAGTLHKNTQITTSGPYGMLRHPLYVGSFTSMLGICTLINDRGENFWVVCGPLLAIFIYRAIKEERHLAAKFPAHWAAYKERVGRFIPRSWPKRVFTDWAWKQWIDNREYRFVSAMLLGLIGLQLWHMFE